MVVRVEGPGLKRLGLALAAACLAATVAGCSETAGQSATAAAVTAAVAKAPPPPARSEFVDAGQPIVLNGASPAAGDASAQPGTTETASVMPRPRPVPGEAGGGRPSAVAAAAIVEPSPADIAPPDQPVAAVTTLSDDAAGSGAETIREDAPTLASGKAMPASEKAKLIDELKALAARQGAGAAAASGEDACADGTNPDCMAAAE